MSPIGMSLSGDVDATHSQSVVTPWPSVTFGGTVVLAPRSVRGSSGPSLSPHSQSVVMPWPSVTFGGAVVSDPLPVCVDPLNGVLRMSERKVIFGSEKESSRHRRWTYR